MDALCLTAVCLNERSERGEVPRRTDAIGRRLLAPEDHRFVAEDLWRIPLVKVERDPGDEGLALGELPCGLAVRVEVDHPRPLDDERDESARRARVAFAHLP